MDERTVEGAVVLLGFGLGSNALKSRALPDPVIGSSAENGDKERNTTDRETRGGMFYSNLGFTTGGYLHKDRWFLTGTGEVI